MLRDWENNLGRKEKEFEERRRDYVQKFHEKEEDIAQKLHAVDLKRADLEEAQCAFKKVCLFCEGWP